MGIKLLSEDLIAINKTGEKVTENYRHTINKEEQEKLWRSQEKARIEKSIYLCKQEIEKIEKKIARCNTIKSKIEGAIGALSDASSNVSNAKTFLNAALKGIRIDEINSSVGALADAINAETSELEGDIAKVEAKEKELEELRETKQETLNKLNGMLQNYI